MNVIMGVASFGPFLWHATKAIMCEFLYTQTTDNDDLVKDLDGMRAVFDQNPKLRKDIRLVSFNETLYPSAVGTNHGCAGAAIVVNSLMQELEPAGTRYLAKAELYKIRHSILVKDQTIKAIATLFTAAVCLVEAASTGVVMPLSALVGAEYLIDYNVTSRWEDQARKFAVKAATEEELKGAMHIFKAASKARGDVELPYDATFVEEELKVRRCMPIVYNQSSLNNLAAMIKSASDRLLMKI